MKAVFPYVYLIFCGILCLPFLGCKVNPEKVIEKNDVVQLDINQSHFKKLDPMLHSLLVQYYRDKQEVEKESEKVESVVSVFVDFEGESETIIGKMKSVSLKGKKYIAGEILLDRIEQLVLLKEVIGVRLSKKYQLEQ